MVGVRVGVKVRVKVRVRVRVRDRVRVRRRCSSERPTKRKSTAMSSRLRSSANETRVERFSASSSRPKELLRLRCWAVTEMSIATQPSSENFLAISSLMYSPRPKSHCHAMRVTRMYESTTVSASMRPAHLGSG